MNVRNRISRHLLPWVAVVLSIGTLPIAAADTPRSTTFDLPPPAPDGFAWEIVPELSDEFSGTTLDERKWLPKHPDWKGREPSIYDPSNVSVKDGMLHLRNTTRLKTLDGVKNPEKDVWVQSACVSSRDRIASYGYYAARMKASRICMTSSFWFQGEHTEIDVVEQFGLSVKNPEEKMLMLMNTHYFPQGWDTDKATPQRWQMPTSSGDAFHVYGVWWKDEKTVWMYHDGQKVAEITTGGPFKEPQYLFFDTEVFVWEGLPTIESLNDSVRNTMLVDWVRAWKLVKKGNAGEKNRATR
jgi:beta-glucanase (GH16 family)